MILWRYISKEQKAMAAKKKEDRDKTPYQKTREKLSGTPFSTVKELEAAEQEIKLENWKRLATYKDFQGQLENEGNESVKKDFETGILCGYANSEDLKAGNGDASILRVFKASAGIQVKINEKKPADPKLVSSLASNMAHAFGALFYEVAGLKKPGPINTDSTATDL